MVSLRLGCGSARGDAWPRAGSPRPCARSGGRRRPSPCRHDSARGGRSRASTPLGRTPIVASGAVRLRHGPQVAAHREHTGGVAPDPARQVAQQQGVQQPQAAIVAGHVRAAQRDEVGLPVTQPPADQPGGEARPAVAQVERLLAPAARGRGATAPTIQRTSSSGCQRLRSRLPTGSRWMRHPGLPDDLEPLAGAARDHVDAQVRPLRQHAHHLRAGDAGAATDRRHLVAQHQQSQRPAQQLDEAVGDWAVIGSGTCRSRPWLHRAAPTSDCPRRFDRRLMP